MAAFRELTNVEDIPMFSMFVNKVNKYILVNKQYKQMNGIFTQ